MAFHLYVVGQDFDISHEHDTFQGPDVGVHLTHRHAQGFIEVDSIFVLDGPARVGEFAVDRFAGLGFEEGVVVWGHGYTGIGWWLFPALVLWWSSGRSAFCCCVAWSSMRCRVSVFFNLTISSYFFFRINGVVGFVFVALGMGIRFCFGGLHGRGLLCVSPYRHGWIGVALV